MNIGSLDDAMVALAMWRIGVSRRIVRLVILASARKSVGCDGVKPMKLLLI